MSKRKRPPADPMVMVPEWAWELVKPVIREALALWMEPNGREISFLPNECFSYRGDQFLPLYRAVFSLMSLVDPRREDYPGQAEMRDLLGFDDQEEAA